MNDDVRPDEVFEIEPSSSDGVLARLPWWLILSVAVVVTELTAHPSIGVIVLCLKFGWNDFRTALWLRRRDPDWRRGAICSWFYFSSGLWRVCLWSLALMLGVVMFTYPIQAQQAGNGGPQIPDWEVPAEFFTFGMVWLTSSAFATVFTMLSVLIARRSAVKIWISGSVSGSRRRDEWPPQPVDRQNPESNLLRWWLLLTGIAVFAPAFTFGLLYIVVFFFRSKRWRPAKEWPRLDSPRLDGTASRRGDLDRFVWRPVL